MCKTIDLEIPSVKSLFFFSFFWKSKFEFPYSKYKKIQVLKYFISIHMVLILKGRVGRLIILWWTGSTLNVVIVNSFKFN